MTFIFAIIVSILIIFAGLYWLKRQITSSVGMERESLTAQIPATVNKAGEMLQQSDQFASKPQLEFLLKQAEAAKAEIQKEKDNLRTIEQRLDQAQKDVESKESQQQELKTAREEEEVQLQELLMKFEGVSTESINLEQRLAASMKNLDVLIEEVELTPDQKGALQDLSNALTEAGSRLRELLLEYTTVKERLQVLKQQHTDLEEEYTHLVEQQLGE